jgi:hypothetical protein
MSIKRYLFKSLTVILTIAFLLVIGAILCDSSNGNLLVFKKVYSGKWKSMFESSLFEPDDNIKNEIWWLDFEKNLNDPRIKFIASDDKFSITTSHITVEGKLSWPGHYGHLGLSTRKLLVSNILEIKDIQSRSTLPHKLEQHPVKGSDSSK